MGWREDFPGQEGFGAVTTFSASQNSTRLIRLHSRPNKKPITQKNKDVRDEIIFIALLEKVFGGPFNFDKNIPV